MGKLARNATDEGAKFVVGKRLLAILFAESAHPHPSNSAPPSPSQGRLTTYGVFIVEQIIICIHAEII